MLIERIFASMRFGSMPDEPSVFPAKCRWCGRLFLCTDFMTLPRYIEQNCISHTNILKIMLDVYVVCVKMGL